MTAAAVDLAPRLERCFLFDAVESTYDIDGITGRLPGWLRGSYYVNGPARFERAGRRYRNWLDGDGMVCALHFGEEGVGFRSRLVQTGKLRQEEEAGRFLYRGFGTAFPGDQLRRKVMLEPPVNVSVYPYDGRLLAFGEQSLPYELDPVTLDTLGPYDFHGALNDVSPFAAHAKFDGGLLNFGVSFSAARPMLHVYEFDHAGQLLKRRRHELNAPYSIHDFGFTRDRAVFFLSPLLMNFQRFWEESVSVVDAMSWEPERGAHIFVAPRSGSAAAAFSVPAGAGYCLHLINCFEEGEQLVVDILELDRPVYRDYQPIPDILAEAPPGRPVRYRIDMRSKCLLEKVPISYQGTPDFPSMDSARSGAGYRDFWMLGIGHSGQTCRKFFNQLCRGSWHDAAIAEVCELPAGEYFGGEPVYVANPMRPEEAVVIVQHLEPETDRAAFWIFDAFALKSGPIVRLPLRHRVHPGFHASFHPGA